MQRDLSWSAFDAGSLAAANAVGYLAGATVSHRAFSRYAPRRLVVGGLVVTASSTAACAVVQHVTVLVMLRTAAGVGSAARVHRRRSRSIQAAPVGRAVGSRGRATSGAALGLGLFSTGPGLGIAVSADGVSPVAASGGWRLSLVILGGLGMPLVH